MRIQKLLEETARLPEPGQEFSDLFNRSPALLAVIGSDGYFKKVSKSWTSILGWSEDELKARPWVEFLDSEDRPLMTIAQGGVRFVNRFKCKDGTRKKLTWLSPEFDSKGLSYVIAMPPREIYAR